MSRRERLRLATGQQHAALDRLIEQKRFFDCLDGYGEWLKSGLKFHRDMEGVLSLSVSASTLPVEALRRRTMLIERDLADLDIAYGGGRIDIDRGPLRSNEALGVLYVTEGASLGARVLLVRAKGLGLSETCGAQHLAYAAHQLAHWRSVVEMLEAFECRDDDEGPMIAAAQWAFSVAIAHWARP